MTCNDFQESLSAYLDRDLHPQDAALMAAHAEACPRCQKERSLVLKFKSVLRDRTMPGIPADLVAAIEAQTLLHPRWWESDVFKTRWLPAIVGLATAVGALWLSKAQVNPRPEAVIPMAARPQPGPVITHARLPQNESPEEEKGETSEHPKS